MKWFSYRDITDLLRHNDITDADTRCVLVGGRVAAATPNWWSLHPDELCLLSLYVWTQVSCDWLAGVT